MSQSHKNLMYFIQDTNEIKHKNKPTRLPLGYAGPSNDERQQRIAKEPRKGK